MNPIQKTARIAGALYVAGSIPGFFAIIYIPGKFESCNVNDSFE